MQTAIARTDFDAIQAAGRDVIEHHIQNVWSLEEYIAYMNADVPPGGGGLVSDLAHWAEYDITTASQLGDYLDGACARNVQKSEMSAYA